MVSVIWGGIAMILALLVVVGESAAGLHADGVSHANVALWLLITPIIAVGSMVHRRRTDPLRYGGMFLQGLSATALATVGLLVVWFFVTGLMVPNYFTLMHGFAMKEAIAQGHKGMQLAMDLHVATLIFASPRFYVISAIVPLLAGTIASFVAAFGLRNRKGTPA
jgi:hypothetical protein